MSPQEREVVTILGEIMAGMDRIQSAMNLKPSGILLDAILWRFLRDYASASPYAIRTGLINCPTPDKMLICGLPAEVNHMDGERVVWCLKGVAG